MPKPHHPKKRFHESLFHAETFLFLCMARKRWTAKTTLTDSLIRLREKRKWQVGFRRYVLEKTPSEAYAPYFGLDIENLRAWFACQFTEGLHWENFGKAWQFDHIVPAYYFDYSNEEDLFLCWNFINLRVEPLTADAKGTNRIDLFAVKSYFSRLYNQTGLPICLQMLQKIEGLASEKSDGFSAQESFILANKTMLEKIIRLTPTEFNRLNKGNTVDEILLEKEIVLKFGSATKP